MSGNGKQQEQVVRVAMANPRGFCAGVDRAIDIVARALEIFGAPVYVRHEVVHNRFVVEDLRGRGAIFVRELDEVPAGATVVFSAHGVAASVREEAERRGLKVLDATCPLVTKVHMEVMHYGSEGRETILIGHTGHPEVMGTMGQYDRTHGGDIYLVESVEDAQALTVNDPGHLAFVTQTTLSVDDTRQIIEVLKARFPEIVGPRKDDICYATQNRQDAVKELANHCDLVLIVGSANSSNSNRLREIAAKRGIEAHLVDNPVAVRPDWIRNKQRIGVSAGASAPEVLVREIVAAISEHTDCEVCELPGVEERITFSLPRELRTA